MYQIESKGYPISENDVIKFENLITSRLPEEYRDFLLKYNVCTIQPTFFKFKKHIGEEGESAIEYFPGFNVNPRKEYYYSLYWYHKTMQGRMPKEFIKIASDPLGNAILIHLEKGSIWFWDHELEADIEDGEEISMANIFFISNDFNSFLDSLYEMDVESF